jgi:hypothetical protein
MTLNKVGIPGPVASGGSSSSSVTVPPSISASPDLVPGTPNALDDEFAGSALSGNWTQVNVSGVTFTVSNSLLTFASPVHAGDSVQQLLKTAPSTPYTLTAKVYAETINIGSGFHFTGLVLKDNSAGKLTIFGPGFRGNVPSDETTVVNYTNLTTFSAYAANSRPWNTSWDRWMYLKILNDGTNLTFSSCGSGPSAAYFTNLTVAKGSFLTTIDRIGLAVTTNDASNPTTIVYDYFRVT